MIYKLRMLSDENDSFLREYEVPGDYTLSQLHDFISGELGFEPDGVVSFFVAQGQWERLTEFTLFDMGDGGPAPMDGVTLDSIMPLPQSRLIYVFDMFNDRALYIESAGPAAEEPGVQYPRTTLSQADAPNQYEAGPENAGNSIFDEAMDEFGEFESNDYYGDEF